MRRCFLPSLALVMLLSVAAGWRVGARSQDAPVAPPPRPWRADATFAFLGTNSCAAAACHNGPGSGAHGREYALALEREPADPRQLTRDAHARAYEVLFEPRARAMERKLRPDDPAARAETDVLCLRCHVHPGVDTSPVRLSDGVSGLQRADGVSCEACHGAAERWLAAHFRPGWSELSAAGRLAQGQVDTRSVAGRVGVCVDCHVGAPGMEVNHDLIAAGHPRLSFEFTGFHSLLHKHWDISNEAPDFDARAWPVGQLIAARAALVLLADRAASLDAERPWPEFAEHDCAACHHDLRASGVQARGATLLPSRWYTALVPEALQQLGHADAAPLVKALKAVDAAMTANRPERRAVADRARRAVALLDEGLARVSDRPADPALIAAIRNRATVSGDERRQVLLALDALQRPRTGGPALHRAEVRALLRCDRQGPGPR